MKLKSQQEAIEALHDADSLTTNVWTEPLRMFIPLKDWPANMWPEVMLNTAIGKAMGISYEMIGQFNHKLPDDPEKRQEIISKVRAAALEKYKDDMMVRFLLPGTQEWTEDNFRRVLQDAVDEADQMARIGDKSGMTIPLRGARAVMWLADEEVPFHDEEVLSKAHQLLNGQATTSEPIKRGKEVSAKDVGDLF